MMCLAYTLPSLYLSCCDIWYGHFCSFLGSGFLCNFLNGRIQFCKLPSESSEQISTAIATIKKGHTECRGRSLGSSLHRFFVVSSYPTLTQVGVQMFTSLCGELYEPHCILAHSTRSSTNLFVQRTMPCLSSEGKISTSHECGFDCHVQSYNLPRLSYHFFMRSKVTYLHSACPGDKGGSVLDQ